MSIPEDPIATRRNLLNRQIHLDFHTGPHVHDVGTQFDAREFAKVMKRAHVNSVTVFAKCHHGHLYYKTTRPERHPGLSKNLDLLRKQVEALHREGIRAPIYLSVQCDEHAANTHPEWVARNPDSSQVRAGSSVFAPGWQILDMATDYQEYLAAQTLEVLRTFKPVDGLFFDMCWDQPSTTAPFMRQMCAVNLNPEKEIDRRAYAHTLALKYMKRFAAMVAAHSPGAGCYFNSRPLSNLAEEIAFQAQVEIEALPTGGWGYMYFPKNVRFARTFGKPYVGMTARFHKGWADFGGLKPYAALEYETSQMMAHGAKCSIGDQLHPRGTTDAGAYQLIGKVFARVKAREPWLDGATPVAQVGLFQASTGDYHDTGGTDEGATRMLTQLKHQFNVVWPTSDLSAYELLILPDAVKVDQNLAGKLRRYLRSGGAILATGLSGLNDNATATAFSPLRIKPLGQSPFSTTYLRFGKAIAADVPSSDHVMYERGIRITAAKGTRVLGNVVEPYYERKWDHFCSHFQTPGSKVSRYPIATLRDRVAYIPFPVFKAFAQHGCYPYRLLVRNIIDLLLPEQMLKIEAPTGTEATVAAQNGRTIIHILHYCAERRTRELDIVEDIVPLHDLSVSIKMPARPKRTYLAPQRQPLAFTWSGGRVTIAVPRVEGHAMIVLE